jgi:hypothetical protein
LCGADVPVQCRGRIDPDCVDAGRQIGVVSGGGRGAASDSLPGLVIQEVDPAVATASQISRVGTLVGTTRVPTARIASTLLRSLPPTPAGIRKIDEPSQGWILVVLGQRPHCRDVVDERSLGQRARIGDCGPVDDRVQRLSILVGQIGNLEVFAGGRRS